MSKTTSYQKLVDENKNLLDDIAILIKGDCTEKNLVSLKWHNQFKKDAHLKMQLNEYSQGYYK